MRNILRFTCCFILFILIGSCNVVHAKTYDLGDISQTEIIKKVKVRKDKSIKVAFSNTEKQDIIVGYMAYTSGVDFDLYYSDGTKIDDIDIGDRNVNFPGYKDSYEIGIISDLEPGEYYLKIRSEYYDFNDTILLRPLSIPFQVELIQCEQDYLCAGIYGKWKTSDSKTVALDSYALRNKKCSCEIWAKKAGTATVTCDTGKGTFIFNITVKQGDVLAGMQFRINSVGGVEPTVYIANPYDKKIKYVRFDAYFYNTVNDPANCTIRKTNTRKMEITGPIEKSTIECGTFNAVIYNSTTGVMKIKNIVVEFMDGTKERISKTYTVKKGKYYGYSYSTDYGIFKK